MKNVVLICPASSQPRYHKRAEQLQKATQIQVFAFRRGWYEQNTFPDSIEYISLGEISDGKYTRRVITMLKAIWTIRRNISSIKNSAYYAMSFDCLLVAKLCGLKNGFYEIGDLRTADTTAKLVTFLENKLIRSTSGVVITSKYFYEDFYKQRDIEASRFYVIENKLQPSFFSGKRPKSASRKPTRKIRIGLVGLLRYETPIRRLMAFAAMHPNRISVECFGDGPCKSIVLENECENIRYHGSFRYPDDIPHIYKTIDINYVVYNNNSKNVRLALPNKLYESAFYGVPILVALDTALHKEITALDIGKGLPISRQSEFNNALSVIDIDWIYSKSCNCFKIADNKLLDEGDLVVKSALQNL